MIFRLQHTTQKKLREQIYLSLFFAVIIWVLMAVLFYSDDNLQTTIIYLVGSAVIIPYLYNKHIKPYIENLSSNVDDAFIEIGDEKIIYNHFNNLKAHGQTRIEFKIKDIVNLKKAFRKDDSVNKITILLSDKRKIIVENFEEMSSLVELLYDKHEQLQAQSTARPASSDTLDK